MLNPVQGDRDPFVYLKQYLKLVFGGVFVLNSRKVRHQMSFGGLETKERNQLQNGILQVLTH